MSGGGSMNCNFSSSTDWLVIGSFPPPTNPGQQNTPIPTADGNDQVHVACTVSGGGGSFSVNLNASLDTVNTGGSLVITGNNISAQGGQGLTATFNSQSGGGYRATGCTLTPPNPGVPNGGAFIAPGRVWAHISCPMATRPDTGSTCDAEADFLFQNCGT
jgi:hypothetical protein